MDAILRALAMYVFLMLIIRISGRRTLSEINTFDFVLLLVIGEATQQALLGQDFSFTNAVLVIIALVLIDVLFALAKRRFGRLTRFAEGEPMLVVEHGRVLTRRLERARLSEGDILEAARFSQGLERIDQIKFAVLEKNGRISVIPKDG